MSICEANRCVDRPNDSCLVDASDASDSEATQAEIGETEGTIEALDEADVDAPETDSNDIGDAETQPDTEIETDTTNDVEDVDLAEVVSCADEGQPCDGIGDCGVGVVECADGVGLCSTDPGGSEVQVEAEICDDRDNDCDGQTDEDFDIGGEVALEEALYFADLGRAKGEDCGTGKCAGGAIVCSSDGLSLRCDADARAETSDTCNDRDDDCDGMIDDEFASTSAVGFRPLAGAIFASDNGKAKGAACGTGACTNGGAGTVECSSDGTKLVCSSDEQATFERCDDIDNDCNGGTDEPFKSPTGTTLQAAKFAADNGKSKGASCGTGPCASGEVVCAAAGSALTCDSDEASTPEVCDRVDNDCDGTTDSQFKYGGLALGAVCDGVGECGTGTVICAVGDVTRATCTTNPNGTNSQAGPEICDDADNDCDGDIDDGLTYAGAALGLSCNGVGECGIGQVECSNSGAPTCSTNPDGSASQATSEICDSQDDDCDGTTDDNCSAVCTPTCQHAAQCLTGNTCDCAGTGYSGSRCETPVCSCVRGTCTAPNSCGSGTGYSGSRCETPVCSGGCQNGGTCTAPNTCSCASGWTGGQCQTAVCNPSCGSHGTCTTPNQCSCASGWTGNQCQTPICTGNCNGNGTCVGAEQCSCSSGWSGPKCEIAVCTSSCGSHGDCLSPNTCSCDAGWDGPLCNAPVCNPGCQNGGTCTSPYICQCPPGLSGPQCQTLTGYTKIVAGTFQMGSPSTEIGRESEGTGSETQHSVTLTRPYWIKTYEVTQAEWESLMGSDPSHFQGCGASCPVEMVNYFDAIEYANALSTAQGLPKCYTLTNCSGTIGISYECNNVSFAGLSCLGYRLPTEAEWEHAARAGTTTATHNGNLTAEDGQQTVLDPIAWYDYNSVATTHRVGLKQPNAWGLYDMLGNVGEWVHDRYQAFGTGAVVDPIGPSIAARIVIRGGAWWLFASEVRSAWRADADPVRLNGVGFRIVRTTQ